MDEQTTTSSNLDLARDRTDLAKYRTQFALDRTTLAWVPTTLRMASFGLGMVGFFRSLRASSPTPEAIRLHQSAIQFGTSLIVPGVAAKVAAAISPWFALRRLRRDEAPALANWTLSITLAFLLSFVGLTALWGTRPGG
jgi:inner membrane protein YidH